MSFLVITLTNATLTVCHTLALTCSYFVEFAQERANYLEILCASTTIKCSVVKDILEAR